MVKFDFYLHAHRIADDLGKHGQREWKKSIEDAIADGSTSTEILMAIRWNLQKCLKEKGLISLRLKKQITDLISKIDDVLREGIVEIN